MNRRRILGIVILLPALLVDALYENIRYAGRVVSMAIMIVCGVNDEDRREALPVEPTLEQSMEICQRLFDKLKNRGLYKHKLIISYAHTGFAAAIGVCFPGASWQRCKAHFMREILVHVVHKGKERFAGIFKSI